MRRLSKEEILDKNYFEDVMSKTKHYEFVEINIFNRILVYSDSSPRLCMVTTIYNSDVSKNLDVAVGDTAVNNAVIEALNIFNNRKEEDYNKEYQKTYFDYSFNNKRKKKDSSPFNNTVQILTDEQSNGNQNFVNNFSIMPYVYYDNKVYFLLNFEDDASKVFRRFSNLDSFYSSSSSIYNTSNLSNYLPKFDSIDLFNIPKLAITFSDIQDFGTNNKLFKAGDGRYDKNFDYLLESEVDKNLTEYFKDNPTAPKIYVVRNYKSRFDYSSSFKENYPHIFLKKLRKVVFNPRDVIRPLTLILLSELVKELTNKDYHSELLDKVSNTANNTIGGVRKTLTIIFANRGVLDLLHGDISNYLVYEKSDIIYGHGDLKGKLLKSFNADNTIDTKTRMYTELQDSTGKDISNWSVDLTPINDNNFIEVLSDIGDPDALIEVSHMNFKDVYGDKGGKYNLSDIAVIDSDTYRNFFVNTAIKGTEDGSGNSGRKYSKSISSANDCGIYFGSSKNTKSLSPKNVIIKDNVYTVGTIDLGRYGDNIVSNSNKAGIYLVDIVKKDGINKYVSDLMDVDLETDIQSVTRNAGEDYFQDSFKQNIVSHAKRIKNKKYYYYAYPISKEYLFISLFITDFYVNVTPTIAKNALIPENFKLPVPEYLDSAWYGLKGDISVYSDSSVTKGLKHTLNFYAPSFKNASPKDTKERLKIKQFMQEVIAKQR